MEDGLVTAMVANVTRVEDDIDLREGCLQVLL